MTTDPTGEPVVESGPRLGRGPRLGGVRQVGSGIAAIGVKELRGRMRGRRAFAILTLYLLLLAGFALMVETLVERSYDSGFGGSSPFASAAVGQGIFAGLLMLTTLQVVFLASSSTSGAISLEREKQTLDLLVATPISSAAIVVGKLLSALTYVFLLIAASVPMMAIVFLYGGVAPQDVVNGYIVLIATALGMGSFGLLCSSAVKRTTAATAITIFGVLALTIGTAFVLIFWAALGTFDANGNRTGGPLGIRSPAVLAYVNPFIAQADVLCGTEASFGGGWCSAVNGLVPSQHVVTFTNDVPIAVPAPDVLPAIRGDTGIAPGGQDMEPAPGVFGAPDLAAVPPVAAEPPSLWQWSVLTWLILSAVFLAASIQLVSPTRRWRPRRRAAARRGAAG